jgi:ABC-type Fe3+/spermidine/putrescine transport system ATPase subunit
MNAGHLVQVATPATIYREPSDGFVARFIGSGAVFSGRAQGDVVQVEHLTLPATAAALHPQGANVEIFIRPESVRLSAHAGDAPPGSVSGDVRETLFLGALTRVRVNLHGAGERLNLWADLPSEQAEAFKPGCPVLATWDATAPRIMPAPSLRAQ